MQMGLLNCCGVVEWTTGSVRANLRSTCSTVELAPLRPGSVRESTPSKRGEGQIAPDTSPKVVDAQPGRPGLLGGCWQPAPACDSFEPQLIQQQPTNPQPEHNNCRCVVHASDPCAWDPSWRSAVVIPDSLPGRGSGACDGLPDGRAALASEGLVDEGVAYGAVQRTCSHGRERWRAGESHEVERGIRLDVLPASRLIGHPRLELGHSGFVPRVSLRTPPCVNARSKGGRRRSKSEHGRLIECQAPCAACAGGLGAATARPILRNST